MKNILSTFQTALKSPSRNAALFDILICAIFGLTCFSFPTFSFLNKLNIITWVLTIVLIIIMIIKVVIVNKRITINCITISFPMFALVVAISSLLNGFVNFSLTAVLMIAVTLIIYIFACENKYLVPSLILFLYFSTLLFLLVFGISNFKALLSMNFTRLGSEFGNVNDIAIFLGLGMVLSLFYILTSKKIVFKILNAFSLLLFIYCGLSTGTRILIFAFFACFLFLIICFFGKRKWYVSLIIILGLATIFAIALSLPLFSSFRERLFSMFETLFGIESKTPTYVDYSSIERLHMFLNGFEMMLRKPLFGYGFHGFHNFSSFGGAWSHNNFSETLACFGLLGTLLYFFPFVYSFLGTKTILARNKKNLVFPSMLLFFFVCMFSFAFDVQKLFSFSIGLIYAYMCNPKSILTIDLEKMFKKNKEVTT